MHEFPDLAFIARYLLLPPQSLFVLLALGFLARRWWPGLGRKLGATAVVLLFLLSTPGVSNFFVVPLERFAAPLSAAGGTGAHAIVVLAAGRFEGAPEYGNSDVPDYISLARLRYAAKLHRETGLPVLVSGGGRYGEESFASGMARALRDEFRIPVKWTEDKSSNTAENASLSANILRRSGVRRILLVTDAMHMPRSVMAFSQTGLEVIAAPTVFLSFPLTDLHPIHFIPTAEGLRRSYYALYQWMGIVWYALHYGMPVWAQNRGFD